jgi:hypothetical protein
MLPQPQLIVEAVRVHVTMWRFQPHVHAPALARAQVWHRCRSVGAARVPAEVKPRRKPHRCALERRGFHVEAKEQARVTALRHRCHHAGHLQIATFEFVVQRLGLHVECAQAAQTEGQRSGAHKRNGRGHAARSRPGADAHQQRQPHHDSTRIPHRRNQAHLLQLQRSAGHEADQSGSDPGCSGRVRVRMRVHAQPQRCKLYC